MLISTPARIHQVFGPEFTWSRKYLVPNSPPGPEFTWSRIHLIPCITIRTCKCWQLVFSWNHTCEPSDGRINSPFFLGHLPISNILPNSPDFYMFLPYSPAFYMFTSQMCNLHHVHLGQGSKMQFEWHLWYFEFLTQCRSLLICFNNFIYPPWVDYFTLRWWLFEYLLASTVNFKIYFIKIN